MDENMELFLHVIVYLQMKHRMMMQLQLARHLERHFASRVLIHLKRYDMLTIVRII